MTSDKSVSLEQRFNALISGAAWVNMGGLGTNGFVVGGADYLLLPIIGGVAFRGLVTTSSPSQNGGAYNGITFAAGLPHGSSARRQPVTCVNSASSAAFMVLYADGTAQFFGLPAGYNSNTVEITGTIWF